jgi:uncharacterized membrane protein YjgN (DUF898 family)
MEPVSIVYRRRPGLLGIAIVNALLNILTLTLYRFWGKTRVRRHIWSCIRINGEPLEYTGTGGELFLGALIVFAVFLLPLIGLSLILVLTFGPEHPANAAVQGIATLVVLVFYGMAVYRARRYRLSRTLWRGIRGTMSGSPGRYTLKYFGALLLKVVTLGWATPAMNLELQHQIANETVFGSEPFRFSGSAGPLYWRYAVCWFSTVLVAFLGVGGAIASFVASNGGSWFLEDLELAQPSPEAIGYIIGLAVVVILVFILLYSLIWAAYTVREMNVFAGYTRFGEARFRLAATTLSIVRLMIGNFLLFVFTLGIGAPFVAQRTIRYVIDRLTVEGTVDWGAIRQSTAAIDRRGEGLADAFDIDIF